MEMERYLNPYKEKILGIGEGNHEEKLRKKCGHNFLKLLCENLRVPYMGYTWFLRLILTDTGRRTGRGNRNRTLLIRGHHGWGSGRTAGRDLTAYEKDMIHYPEAHIYCFGHTHSGKLGKPYHTIGLSGNTIIQKTKVLLTSGGYQKTLSEGEDAGYAEIKDYPPGALGVPRVSIKVTERWLNMEVTT